jgi:hypothetical protein
MDAKERPAPNPLRSSAEGSADEIVFVVEGSSDEGGYTARAVGHSVFAEGETLGALEANVRSAVACHFGDEIAGRTSARLLVGGAQVVLKPHEPG